MSVEGCEECGVHAGGGEGVCECGCHAGVKLPEHTDEPCEWCDQMIEVHGPPPEYRCPSVRVMREVGLIDDAEVARQLDLDDEPDAVPIWVISDEDPADDGPNPLFDHLFAAPSEPARSPKEER